jgi:hypothetical protein
LEKLKNLKIIDRILVLGFLLVIVENEMNFKDQFLEKPEVKVTIKEISLTETVDIQSNNEVTIDISEEVIKSAVYKLKTDFSDQ